MKNQIVLEAWGDLACFTRPESKVERLSYPVPTPSAMRGLLSAIYSKPNEFYWQINRIEVLKPIQYISFKRNEVKVKVSKSPILVEDNRTQRQSVFLRDVRYRVFASIIKRESFGGSLSALYDQAWRRIRAGKCYFQPCFGCRECIAYYEESDGILQSINESMDLGFMLYDVFDLHQFEVLDKTKPYISIFHAVMENGAINIPDYDSELVLKPGEVK